MQQFRLAKRLFNSVLLHLKVHIPISKKGIFLLDHIEDCSVLVEPHVVIGYRHRLKRDLFGVFEKRVRSPDQVKPFDRK